ncbi:ribosomal protein L5 domain-containing protein [Peziza echinospora]|nr:ribosomal protein L5 domain-containing protein [Peziza echinospora]
MASPPLAIGRCLLLRTTRPVPASSVSCLRQSAIAQPTSGSAIANATSLARRRAKRTGEPMPDPTKHTGYQFRPPRFYRGPLNPIQPPSPSSPVSREFVPGPFTTDRLHDHYINTLAPDLLALTYDHLPYNHVPKPALPRLRPWDDTSPFYKNRPLRGPRGGGALRLLTPPRTHQNVPKLTGVTVHSFVKGAINEPGYLYSAGMAIQAITGVRATVCNSKHHIAPFGLKDDVPIAVKSRLIGMPAYRFLASIVDVVMPRIKDYKGVKGSSGDNSGNISFGFTPEEVSLFPEIEVNYDMYPAKMIPGCHVTVHTSATNDRDARLLLTAFGVPFFGKFKD